MKDTYSIYSTPNANGVEGKKRCIYEEILKDFKQVYSFEYLIQFFEAKARKYFAISIAEDEKDVNEDIDFSATDNYFSVLQIVWVVKTLKAFYDEGYDLKIVKISSEHNGWIMKFTFDFSKLTTRQAEIVCLNCFERNQLCPDNIIY